MTKRIALDHIVKATAEKASFQADWDRQRETAKAIASRFEDGFDTVLLADEVGMGKTYVALNVMAEHIMQSRENDRKVLLITPPSSVLRDKWAQEIHSFDQKYIRHPERHATPSAGQSGETWSKRLRPLQVDNYWTLLGNLNDFADHGIQKANSQDSACFLYFFNEWDNDRKSRSTRRARWPKLRDFDIDGLEFYDFCARFSEHAIYAFLNELNGSESMEIDSIIVEQKKDICPSWKINNLFKRFASQQDRFEANIFIMGMGVLRRPRSDSVQYKQLCMYLLGRRWSGLHSRTREAIARSLYGAKLLPSKEVHYWDKYVEQIDALGRVDFYGLAAATDAVMATQEHGDAWRALSARLRNGDSTGADVFFANFCEALLMQKLRLANVGLAVIDEVHNWKNGKLGARNFANEYAPGIDHKLIMSATPFQIEEGEIRRLFDFVADPQGQSVATIKSIFAPQGKVEACLQASQAFSDAWKSLSKSDDDVVALTELLLGRDPATLPVLIGELVGDTGRSDILRGFFAAARDHRSAVFELQQQLHKIAVRHTKPRKKRNFHIGADFAIPNLALPRTGLYLGKGYAGKDDALINFVGMRLGQLIRRQSDGSKQENGRLLAGITSSRSAFQASRKEADKKRGAQPSLAYGGLFDSLLATSVHPKVEATAQRAFANFIDGRKTLIFCERVATLKEIQELLLLRVDAFVNSQSSQEVKKRTSLLKETAFVDNTWWLSLLQAADAMENGEVKSDADLAQASAFAKSSIVRSVMKASPRRTIRLVDLHMLATARAKALMAENDWTAMSDIFSALYATVAGKTVVDADAALAHLLNGEQRAKDEQIETPIEDEAADDIDDAIERVYVQRNNLWQMDSGTQFHRLLWQLVESEAKLLLESDGVAAQKGAALINIMSDLFEGLRKIVLRDDLLSRYGFFSKAADKNEAIREGFCAMPVGQDTMLGRVMRFLEALLQESGSINRALRQNSKRQSLWQGVFLQDPKSVETLSGEVSDPMRRLRLCAAFNSPLMPDVLICTSIGSEGIDLHRQCAEIIHHDLPWNPARLEQRNGRVDRVNSLAENTQDLRIEIGIPFLAHNYEEFQYRVVYSRAQKFEILMGSPSYSIDIDEETFTDDSAVVTELEEQATAGPDEVLAVIPEVLINYLRMDLSIVP